MQTQTIDRCQISGSKNLESILFLGYVPPVNHMERLGSRPFEQSMYPLELLYCPDSHLVQIGCQVDPHILFPPEYPYTSGTTRILRDNFAQLARECQTLLSLTPNDLIIDVGANDGTLLSNFVNLCRVLGIEPTDRADLAQKAGIDIHKAYFNSETASTVRNIHGQARLITAANVFAHMPNIDDVLHGILNLLDDDGVFISESHYLLDLINTLQFDTIYHEHLRYYSLHALQYLFRKRELDIFRVQRIPTHGGSIRVFAARKGCRPIEPSVFDLLEEENRAGLLNLQTYQNFAKDVAQFKQNLLKMICDLRSKNKRIYGIGAPSRASTLITYAGLDHDMIDCVLEVPGSYKLNKYMPGTRIPVLDETLLFDNPPDYALLLSWHIAEELMPKLAQKGFEGKFIIPLPNPRIVSL